MFRAHYPRVTHPFAAFHHHSLRSGGFSLDLHVLSTPPAFVLSQDQTLRRDFETDHQLRTTNDLFIESVFGRIYFFVECFLCQRPPYEGLSDKGPLVSESETQASF